MLGIALLSGQSKRSVCLYCLSSARYVGSLYLDTLAAPDYPSLSPHTVTFDQEYKHAKPDDRSTDIQWMTNRE